MAGAVLGAARGAKRRFLRCYLRLCKALAARVLLRWSVCLLTALAEKAQAARLRAWPLLRAIGLGGTLGSPVWIHFAAPTPPAPRLIK